MQLNLARKGNGLNGGWHKGAIAILMKGVLDKGRCWKDSIHESAFALMLSF